MVGILGFGIIFGMILRICGGCLRPYLEDVGNILMVFHAVLEVFWGVVYMIKICFRMFFSLFFLLAITCTLAVYRVYSPSRFFHILDSQTFPASSIYSVAWGIRMCSQCLCQLHDSLCSERNQSHPFPIQTVCRKLASFNSSCKGLDSQQRIHRSGV